MYFCGPLYMEVQGQDEQLKHAYSSSVPIRDVPLKTCRNQWTIGRGGERGSEISVLVARRDDIYIYIYIYIVIYRQTVSLNHNSSVWLDSQDVSSWNRNPADFTSVSYPTAIVILSIREGIFTYTFLQIGYRLPRELNSSEMLLHFSVWQPANFPKYIYIRIYYVIYITYYILRNINIYIYIYIYIYILPYPRTVEFSGEEVIVLPLAYIASLFIYELRSR